jgi:hypothetical protein
MALLLTMKSSLVLTGVLLAALLGACSNSERPALTQDAEASTALRSASSTPVAVAWSERFCRALLPIVQGAEAPPHLVLSDPEGSRQRLHTYLHNQVEALNTALTRIAAAGPAPVDKGSQVDQVLVTALSLRRDTLEAGLAQLDAVPLRQPETLKYTLTAVTSLLVPTDGKTLLGLTVPINMQTPIRQASTCQTLDASRDAGGPTSPP